MRKPDTLAAKAAHHPMPAVGRGQSPTELVCLALVIAVIALAVRIAAIW